MNTQDSAAPNTEWQPISTAPRDTTKFRARTKDGTVYEDVHYAQDFSGEYQPAFSGFYRPSYDSKGKFLEYWEVIGLVEWMPIDAALSALNTKQEGGSRDAENSKRQ